MQHSNIDAHFVILSLAYKKFKILLCIEGINIFFEKKRLSVFCPKNSNLFI